MAYEEPQDDETSWQQNLKQALENIEDKTLVSNLVENFDDEQKSVLASTKHVTYTENVLMSKPGLETRKNLALNPQTSAQTLKILGKHPNMDIRINVARNPSTPVETLEKLGQDPYSDVFEIVYANPSMPRSKIFHVLETQEPYVCAEAAKNPALDAKELHVLAKTPKSDYFHVDSGIAQNPECENETLKLLFERWNHKSLRIERILLEHPNWNRQDLHDITLKIGGSGSEAVLAGVAANPNVGLETIKYLLKQNVLPVNINLSVNPQSTGETLETIYSTGRGSTAIMLNILRNPNTPCTLIEKLFQNHYSKGFFKTIVNTMVAKHPNTPLEVKNMLLENWLDLKALKHVLNLETLQAHAAVNKTIEMFGINNTHMVVNHVIENSVLNPKSINDLEIYLENTTGKTLNKHGLKTRKITPVKNQNGKIPTF